MALRFSYALRWRHASEQKARPRLDWKAWPHKRHVERMVFIVMLRVLYKMYHRSSHHKIVVVPNHGLVLVTGHIGIDTLHHILQVTKSQRLSNDRYCELVFYRLVGIKLLVLSDALE